VRLAEFVIRPSTENDLASIKGLIRTTRLNPFGLEWQHFVVVLSAQGIFAGCGQIKYHNDGSRELASIAVVSEYRKHGVARMIIEHLLAKNPPPLYLMCRSGLEPFYRKFGFHPLEYVDMPPYFQRISRLGAAMMRLVKRSEHLLVMKLDG
jgi:N-acetylglutamate synthase-like GNAT family acetyltransferase